MNRCRPRCERLTIGKSDLKGYDLLVCRECGRPIGVKVQGKPRPAPYRARRGDLARARRARVRNGL